VKVRRHRTPGEAAEATPRLLQILPAVASSGPTVAPGPAGWSAATWRSA
jgi:hypothetical protein